MKFEKLNEDKIRITLNTKDLIDQNIDFESLINNTEKSQDLFLNMLDEAEKQIGFITKDHQIKIEALATSDGDFIITVTRLAKTKDSVLSESQKKSIKKFKKNDPEESENFIYCFDKFDDFCLFSKNIQHLEQINKIAKNTALYIYNEKYYLVFTKLNKNYPNINQIYSLITEFGTYVSSTDLFISKLKEHGKILINANAINKCLKYFSH